LHKKKLRQCEACKETPDRRKGPLKASGGRKSTFVERGPQCRKDKKEKREREHVALGGRGRP